MKNSTPHNELQKKWDECLAFIRGLGLVSPDQYNAWLEPVAPLKFEDNRLDVHVPSSYFHEHLELHYGHVLFPAIKKVFGADVSLYYNYEIKGGDESTNMSVKTENQSVKVTAQDSSAGVSSPFVPEKETEEELDSQLNPRYNFDNYCVSSCNKLAKSVGEAIANDPKCKTFNPLFIYGSSGVGKTHLMHAIGIGIKEQSPEARVLYVTSRLFESQFVYASRKGRYNDFLKFYQGIDCLIIDDIQDLIGKTATQKAFFHIFNQLQLNNRQIIISSDCIPSEMEGLPERLLTRLKWGMTVKLEKPDYELRLQILQQKAQTEGISLSNELLQLIASSVTDSIRELEGIMVSLMARATFMGEELSAELVESILEHSTNKKRRQINFEMITQSVSSYYNIDPDSLFTKDRRREISDARQMIMYLAKKHTDMKFKAIATRLARNHSTVMHACKTIDARLGIEKQLQKDIREIEKELIG